MSTELERWAEKVYIVLTEGGNGEGWTINGLLAEYPARVAAEQDEPKVGASWMRLADGVTRPDPKPPDQDAGRDPAWWDWDREGEGQILNHPLRGPATKDTLNSLEAELSALRSEIQRLRDALMEIEHEGEPGLWATRRARDALNPPAPAGGAG